MIGILIRSFCMILSILDIMGLNEWEGKFLIFYW
jgi:hypothetical protein